MGRFQPQGLHGIPAGSAGQFRIRVVLGTDGAAPAICEAAQGFGSGTVELVDDFDGDTYRAVYTVRFESAVYVLHAFKKKSKQGIKTPQTDIALIKRWLKSAEPDYAARLK